MGRIRSIKPEMPQDEALGRCSRDARLMSRDLLTLADDYGRFRASAAYLRGQLFIGEADEDVTCAMVNGWVNELARETYVVLYTVRGQRYGYIRNWAKHQRVDNAGKPVWPSPDEADEDAAPQFAAVRGGAPHSAAERGNSPLESMGSGIDLESIGSENARACAMGDDPTEEDPFGGHDREGPADCPHVAAYREAKIAVGVEPDLISPSAEAAIHAGARSLLDKGAAPEEVSEAARRLARNPNASPHRLDIEYDRLMTQRAAPKRMNAAQQRVAAREEFLNRHSGLKAMPTPPPVTIVEATAS